MYISILKDKTWIIVEWEQNLSFASVDYRKRTGLDKIREDKMIFINMRIYR